MKEEILQEIRQKYQTFSKKQKNNQRMMKRIRELEETEEVQEYLSLIDKVTNVDDKIEEGELMEKAFRQEAYKIKETNQIYVYMGTYIYSSEIDIVHGSRDPQVNRSDPNADYSLYIDLENNMLSKQVRIKDREEFEKSHTIIYPKCFFSQRKYYELQKEFIEEAIVNGQESAVQRMLKLVDRK